MLLFLLVEEEAADTAFMSGIQKMDRGTVLPSRPPQSPPPAYDPNGSPARRHLESTILPPLAVIWWL
jgi:hypothetical protein